MSFGRSVHLLENKLNYTFSDVSLLETALTHSSYANETRSRGEREVSSNERLEFLGDAVLQMVISEYLYASFPGFDEGNLTKIRKTLVCRETLISVAEEFEIPEFMIFGSDAESNGCRGREKIAANAVEAVIGAVYLDAKGNGAEREAVFRLLGSRISEAVSPTDDSKTRLQQLVEQAGNNDLLEYEVAEESGPAHDRRFTVVAKVNNNVVGRGSASTKKDAEMRAAEAALRLFGESRS